MQNLARKILHGIYTPYVIQSRIKKKQTTVYTRIVGHEPVQLKLLKNSLETLESIASVFDLQYSRLLLVITKFYTCSVDIP